MKASRAPCSWTATVSPETHLEASAWGQKGRYLGSQRAQLLLRTQLPTPISTVSNSLFKPKYSQLHLCHACARNLLWSSHIGLNLIFINKHYVLGQSRLKLLKGKSFQKSQVLFQLHHISPGITRYNSQWRKSKLDKEGGKREGKFLLTSLAYDFMAPGCCLLCVQELQLFA